MNVKILQSLNVASIPTVLWATTTVLNYYLALKYFKWHQILLYLFLWFWLCSTTSEKIFLAPKNIDFNHIRFKSSEIATGYVCHPMNIRIQILAIYLMPPCFLLTREPDNTGSECQCDLRSHGHHSVLLFSFFIFKFFHRRISGTMLLRASLILLRTGFSLITTFRVKGKRDH